MYPYRMRDPHEERFQENLLDTTDRLSKNGKNIVGGSLGGGATTNIQDNHLTDINITIEYTCPDCDIRVTTIERKIKNGRNN